MGINNSSQSSRQYQQLLSQFQILQENPDKGLIYLEHRLNKQQYLLRQISCHDTQTFSRMQQLLRLKMSQLDNNRHIVPLRKIITNSEDQYCMSFQKLYVLFEFPQRTLDDEINERNLQKRNFQQKQLWSILASCILGMSQLQKLGIKHNALKSSSILISHDGIIQIYDPITTGSLPNYDKLLNYRSTPHIYLSPQQVEALREECVRPDCNASKSDIWTLGMIILQAGLLAYQDDCYRDQCARIHWQTLHYNLTLFQKYYSPELVNLVEFMLGQDERSRPDWSQLEEHVIKIQQDGRSSNTSDHHNNSLSHKDLSLPFQGEGSIISAAVNNSFQHTPKQIQNRSQQPVTSATKAGIRRSKVNSSSTYRQQKPIREALPALYGAAQINIKPLAISDISISRPLRNIFPSCFYHTQTRPDQNIVMIAISQKNEHFQNSNRTSSAIQYQRISIPHNNYESAYQKTKLNPPLSNVRPISFQFNKVPLHNSSTFTIQKPKAPLYQNLPIQQFNSQHAPNIQQRGQYIVEQYAQGSRYQGYKLNGLKHGQGKFYYQDGGKYEGEYRYGKMQGFGKLYYQSDRLAYEGNWSQDMFHGKGIIYNQSPQTLIGTFDYKNFDQVEQFWTKYQGDFQYDMKDGWGTLYLSNGEFFEGQFKKDFAEGQGKFTTLHGKQVQGRWHSNIME